MSNSQNLTPWKPGQSGNPAGKPIGTKHLSTYIQEYLRDENFEANLLDPKIGIREFKGAPIKAIIQVATTKAINGDYRAMEWLAKYGYGSKIQIEETNEISPYVQMSDEELEDELARLLNHHGWYKQTET